MVVLVTGSVVSSEGRVDAVTLVGREGEVVLRLDFMGCVWRGLRGVVRHTVTVSRPRVGVNQSVPTTYPQIIPAKHG